MKTYVYSVICVTLFTAVMKVIAPEKNGMSKYVSFICALAVALTLLSPLCRDITEISTDESILSGAEHNGEQAEKNAGNYAGAAADMLSVMSGADKERITADVDTDANGNILQIRLYCDEQIGENNSYGESLSDIFDTEIIVIGSK